MSNPLKMITIKKIYGVAPEVLRGERIYSSK
jgi:hypothetical protein